MLRERFDAETSQTTMLRLQVKQLTEQLDEAIEAHRLKPPPAPYWVGLPEPEFRAQITELREWVETFLRSHYPEYVSVLRPCWTAHPAAVWELSTLRAEWLRIYDREKDRELAGALTWHERWFPGVLARIQKAVPCDETGCRLTRYRTA